MQEFASRFRAAHGSILCRELLSGVPTTPGAVPEARTEQYYTVRPCPNIVREAAEILDALLRETEA